MRLVLFPVGVLVLLATTADLFATVSQPGRRGGFIAARLVDVVWRAALGLHRRWPSHRRLAAAGIMCVVAVPIWWMATLWLGWSLVFMSSDHAVVDADTGNPSGTTARAYYAGYSLFTSGLGDKLPGGGVWEVATVLATATGLGLVTLAITYLMPVVQAGTARRSFAHHVTWLGATPDGIVARCWRPPEITTLADEAAALLPRLGTLTEQHLTYPVLHYLHSIDVATAFGPRVVALHDAMLIASEHGADDASRLRFRMVRSAVDDLTGTLPIDDDDTSQEPELPTSLAAGRAAVRTEETSRRRRRLRQLVEHDGWDWSAVDAPGI